MWILLMGWHRGERTMQAAVGFEKGPALRRAIHDRIPPAAQDFLREQSLAFITTVDGDGRPRVAVLAGPPGLFSILDDRTIEISPVTDPAIAAHVATRPHLGLLAIDFGTRRRMRLNGRAETRDDGAIVVRVDEVYGNCPKYIQKRVRLVDPGLPADGQTRSVTAELSPRQVAWIERADTFLIGTRHREAGADTSHRGGPPGFVKVNDSSHLTFPDYVGNFMFQTLGNLLGDSRAGLLFLDFDTGATLQVLGRAEIDHDPLRRHAFPGAERLLDVEIDEVVVTAGALPGKWRWEETSPFNPR